MNKYDLFEAIGGVDEELLARAAHKPTKKLPLRRFAIAVAAVMALAVTVAAAPIVRGWFFASGGESQYDSVIREYQDGGIGISNASIEATLTVPNAPYAPDVIEEYRMPGYFAENGWLITADLLLPEEPWMSANWSYSDEAETHWASFQQDVLYRYNASDPQRYNYYSVDAGLHGQVDEECLTVCEWTATVYCTLPSEIDGVSYDPGRKTIIWSDGDYAYKLECDYEMPLEMISEIVLSLAPVDISSFGTVNPNSSSVIKPIETFYSLTQHPEGYELLSRGNHVNMAIEVWINEEGNQISLTQSCHLGLDNDGPAISIEDTLFDLKMNQREFTAETVTVDDTDVILIQFNGGGPLLMWETEEYAFCLDFTHDHGYSRDALVELFRSVQPMPDYTDHLTD